MTTSEDEVADGVTVVEGTIDETTVDEIPEDGI